LLLEAQTFSAWEPSKKQCYFGISGALSRNERSLVLVVRGLGATNWVS